MTGYLSARGRRSSSAQGRQSARPAPFVYRADGPAVGAVDVVPHGAGTLSGSFNWPSRLACRCFCMTATRPATFCVRSNWPPLPRRREGPRAGSAESALTARFSQFAGSGRPRPQALSARIGRGSPMASSTPSPERGTSASSTWSWACTLASTAGTPHTGAARARDLRGWLGREDDVRLPGRQRSADCMHAP